MNPGELRHVVRIEQRSTVQDGAGEPLNTWTLFAERRASLEARAGSEVWSSAERQGRVPTVFTLRYLPGVLPQMRVIHAKDGVQKVFDILSAVDPTGREELLVITAELRVGEPAT